MFNRDGEIVLYLFTAKLMHLPDFYGGHDAMLTFVEPAPKSK